MGRLPFHCHSQTQTSWWTVFFAGVSWALWHLSEVREGHEPACELTAVGFLHWTESSGREAPSALSRLLWWDGASREEQRQSAALRSLVRRWGRVRGGCPRPPGSAA